jgi:hypothetical protein
LRVIGEDEQLTRWNRSVDAVECRFLHISNNDSCTNNVDGSDTSGETLLVSCKFDIGP